MVRSLAKKCFRAALYIIVLLLICFCTLCVFADSAQQSASVCGGTAEQPQASGFDDEITITQPESNSPHGHNFEVQRPSLERLSSTRNVTGFVICDGEPHYFDSAQGICAIPCSELNKISFQLILKQNE